MLKEDGGTGALWWVQEYTAVPDPIEADTDSCFDTCAEAAEHGEPWAVVEHPAACASGPVAPGLSIVAGPPARWGGAVRCLASDTPVRDGDRGVWSCLC